ncbi:DNA-binding protein [Bacillus phage Silence]|nr:DNA-binding protein [Bacillus phage Silence]
MKEQLKSTKQNKLFRGCIKIASFFYNKSVAKCCKLFYYLIRRCNKLKQMLTVKELASILKVDRTTIWRWRQKGMPCEKYGGTIRFDLEKVKDWAGIKN